MMQPVRRSALVTTLLVCLTMTGSLRAAGADAESAQREMTQPARSTATSSPLVSDVRLGESDQLTGRIVDQHGAIIGNTGVTIFSKGTPVASLSSNEFGEFHVRGLRPGLHTIRTAQSVTVCRFWRDSCAPPTARHGVIVVSAPDIVRGQGNPCQCEACERRRSPQWMNSRALVGAAVVGGVVAVAHNYEPSRKSP